MEYQHKCFNKLPHQPWACKPYGYNTFNTPQLHIWKNDHTSNLMGNLPLGQYLTINWPPRPFLTGCPILIVSNAAMNVTKWSMSYKQPSKCTPINQPQPILLFDLFKKMATSTLALKHHLPKYQDYLTFLLPSWDCYHWFSPPLHAVPQNLKVLTSDTTPWYLSTPSPIFAPSNKCNRPSPGSPGTIFIQLLCILPVTANCPKSKCPTYPNPLQQSNSGIHMCLSYYLIFSTQ